MSDGRTDDPILTETFSRPRHSTGAYELSVAVQTKTDIQHRNTVSFVYPSIFESYRYSSTRNNERYSDRCAFSQGTVRVREYHLLGKLGD